MFDEIQSIINCHNLDAGVASSGQYSEKDSKTTLSNALKLKVLESNNYQDMVNFNQTIARMMDVANAYPNQMTRLIKLLNNEQSEKSFLETLEWYAVVGDRIVNRKEVDNQPNR